MNTAQVTGVAGALGDANAALPARKQVRIGDRVVEVNSVRCSSGGECLRAEILASRGSAGVRLSLQRAETPEALASAGAIRQDVETALQCGDVRRALDGVRSLGAEGTPAPWLVAQLVKASLRNGCAGGCCMQR